MINEEKLEKFLRSLMIWTDLSGKPDVHKLLMKQLNESFKEEKGCGKELGNCKCGKPCSVCHWDIHYCLNCEDKNE